ncbi:hypothetical protein CXG81DRAFT_17444 [Caulochytrium protostelioides]|uniref:Rap-GAP domain-containing protein n=1 Tax=Caulochytrium protostelioides TaxID=1555241 RepID=A0A4V1IV59_9FUNG|nr:hypothetical protein CXG81DRAFT_17444 [Caulochytrium protostelioides]|eukprot:RKP02919.1 hypothetical protein CXG81DRAFT_17444 [Caulochytrium protostelioides]
MFLRHIQDLGLLELNPNSGTISQFPLAVRRKLVWEVTQCFIPHNPVVTHPQALIASPSHLLWVMEATGQAFALPIENIPVIQASVTVYTAWLLEPKSSPLQSHWDNYEEVEQTLWQDMFKHFSLLFEPRQPDEFAAAPQMPTNGAASLGNGGSTNNSGGGGGSGGGGLGGLTATASLGGGGHGNSSALANGAAQALLPATAIVDSIDNLLTAQADLCKNVLKIMATSAKQLGSRFSKATWIVLLKVLLGITDRLLSEPLSTPRSPAPPPAAAAGHASAKGDRGDASAKTAAAAAAAAAAASPEVVSTGPRIADDIVRPLMQALCETWLRSGIMDEAMWASLRRLFVRWTHRIDVVRACTVCITGMTHNVIHHLYGPQEGAATVNLDIRGGVALQLSPSFLSLAWHKFIALLDNPCTYAAPILNVAINGIADVAAAFRAIKTNPPDGNTILHMFGAWLFEALTLRAPEYIEARSATLAILCQTFTQHQRRAPFLRIYLERFYAALHAVLSASSITPETLTAIVFNSTALFTRGLAGVRILVPDFIAASRHLLPAVQFRINNADGLQRATLALLQTIAVVPFHFHYVPLPSFSPLDNLNYVSLGSPSLSVVTPGIPDPWAAMSQSVELPTFARLKPVLINMLHLSLRSPDMSSTNIRHIFHMLVCIVNCDPEASLHIIEGTISSCEDMLFTWPASTIQGFLHHLNNLNRPLDAINEHLPEDELVDSPGSRVLVHAVTVVTRLLEYLFQDNLVTTQKSIITSYDTLVRLCLTGRWWNAFPSVQRSVLAVLCRGITTLDRDEPFAAIADDPAQALPGGLSVGGPLGSATAIPASLAGSHVNSRTASVNLGTRGEGSMAGSVVGSLGGPGGPGGGVGMLGTGVLGVHMAGAGDDDSASGSSKPRRPRVPASHRLFPRTANKTSLGLDRGGMNPKETSSAASASGVGIPTFATLSAEMMVKIAAETALNQLSHQLGHVPPPNERVGITSMSSIWSERDRVAELQAIAAEIVAQQGREPPLPGKRPTSASEESGHVAGSNHRLNAGDNISVTSERTKSLRRLVRYFCFDNRVILGFVDNPAWAKEATPGTEDASSTVLVLRDSAGRYTWNATLRYLETKANEEAAAAAAATAAAASAAAARAASSAAIPTMSATASGTLAASQSDPLLESLFTTAAATVSPPPAPSYHFEPRLPPQEPPGASVVHYTAFTESSIPVFEDLLRSSQIAADFSVVRHRMDAQIRHDASWVRSAYAMPHLLSLPGTLARAAAAAGRPGSGGAAGSCVGTPRSAAVAPAAERDTGAGDFDPTIVAQPPPSVAYRDPEMAPPAFRFFLTHMGYLVPEARGKLVPLALTPGLMKDLERFDALSERETLAFGVLYIGANRTLMHAEDLIQTQAVSEDFARFVRGLGWPIDVATHRGFKGTLDPDECRTGIYYASRTSEMLFYTPMLLQPDREKDADPPAAAAATPRMSVSTEMALDDAARLGDSADSSPETFSPVAQSDSFGGSATHGSITSHTTAATTTTTATVTAAARDVESAAARPSAARSAVSSALPVVSTLAPLGLSSPTLLGTPLTETFAASMLMSASTPAPAPAFGAVAADASTPSSASAAAADAATATATPTTTATPSSPTVVRPRLAPASVAKSFLDMTHDVIVWVVWTEDPRDVANVARFLPHHPQRAASNPVASSMSSASSSSAQHSMSASAGTAGGGGSAHASPPPPVASGTPGATSHHATHDVVIIGISPVPPVAPRTPLAPGSSPESAALPDDGLVQVKIMTKPNVEDLNLLGPLTDGMIVPRRVLGPLVRLSAMTAHTAVRTFRGLARRPATTRRQQIEELASKHRVSLSLAEFYSDILCD